MTIKKKILFGLFIFSIFSEAYSFKPALDEAKQARLTKCMEKNTKHCESADEKTKCKVEALKNMDRGCKKLLGQAHQSLLPMGMACYGMMKICPFPAGESQESLAKFEACVEKNIDKMPPSCKGMMRSLNKGMTGGTKNYEEVEGYIKKYQKSGGGQNVQVQQKK